MLPTWAFQQTIWLYWRWKMQVAPSRGLLLPEQFRNWKLVKYWSQLHGERVFGCELRWITVLSVTMHIYHCYPPILSIISCFEQALVSAMCLHHFAGWVKTYKISSMLHATHCSWPPACTTLLPPCISPTSYKARRCSLASLVYPDGHSQSLSLSISACI